MKLKKLLQPFPEIQVKGSKDREVLDIVSQSQMASPGSLFIARRGEHFDGNKFVPQAIESGAVCVMSDLYDPSLTCVTQLIVEDLVGAEAKLAARLWSNPSHELEMIGVTGTSGKTTTSYMLYQILSFLGEQSGLIGTVAYIGGSQFREASRTTPEASVTQKLLREMLLHGARSCVMEVSSHALAQRRVDQIRFTGAIFTNLSHEHLDYHGSMQEYAKAKSLLFQGLSEQAIAVVNGQDPYVEMVTASKARTCTYAVDAEADLVASELEMTSAGTRCTLTYKGVCKPVEIALVGRFNVENMLAAVGYLLLSGRDFDKIIEVLARLRPPPGRLEKVETVKDVDVYVDYAHKEDALEKTLTALREVCTGRIITVFGCGGCRDREKRPSMAKVAERLSDLVVVTSDNPRTEDPMRIIDEICTGFSKLEPIVEPSRKEAIERSLALSHEGDIVLIAGRGHEKKQVLADRTIEFDDAEVVRQWRG